MSQNINKRGRSLQPANASQDVPPRKRPKKEETSVAPIHWQNSHESQLPPQTAMKDLETGESVTGSQSSILKSAQNVAISDSTFTSLQGSNIVVHCNLNHDNVLGVLGYQVPMVSAGVNGTDKPKPEVLDASAGPLGTGTLINITRRSCDIYYSQLLLKGRGSPLWSPGPSRNLPVEYRREGVLIGDVGIITKLGGFSFLFNIFLPAGHPINRNDVPECFKPMDQAGIEHDIHDRLDYDENSYMASSSVRTASSSDGTAGLTFETSAMEGAILTMPHGASSKDLLDVQRMESYAAMHAESWYMHANTRHGRKAKNGDILLVCGWDKVASWGIATIASQEEVQLQLKFKEKESSNRNTPSYEWNCLAGTAEYKVGPSREREMKELIEEPGRDRHCMIENQCVFLRTVNATLADTIWNKLGFDDNLPDGPGPAGNNYASNPDPPADSGSGGAPAAPNSPGSSSSAPSRGSDSSHRQYSYEYQPRFIETPTVHRPSTALNRQLLKQNPNAKIAITQDANWISVISKEDSVFPTDEELCARVFKSHDTCESDGVISLRVKGLRKPAFISGHTTHDVPESKATDQLRLQQFERNHNLQIPDQRFSCDLSGAVGIDDDLPDTVIESNYLDFQTTGQRSYLDLSGNKFPKGNITPSLSSPMPSKFSNKSSIHEPMWPDFQGPWINNISNSVWLPGRPTAGQAEFVQGSSLRVQRRSLFDELIDSSIEGQQQDSPQKGQTFDSGQEGYSDQSSLNNIAELLFGLRTERTSHPPWIHMSPRSLPPLEDRRPEHLFSGFGDAFDLPPKSPTASASSPPSVSTRSYVADPILLANCDPIHRNIRADTSSSASYSSTDPATPTASVYSSLFEHTGSPSTTTDYASGCETQSLPPSTLLGREGDHRPESLGLPSGDIQQSLSRGGRYLSEILGLRAAFATVTTSRTAPYPSRSQSRTRPVVQAGFRPRVSTRGKNASVLLPQSRYLLSPALSFSSDSEVEPRSKSESSSSDSEVELTSKIENIPKGKHKRRSRGRSRSITPPPALPQDQIQNVKNVTRQTLQATIRLPSEASKTASDARRLAEVHQCQLCFDTFTRADGLRDHLAHHRADRVISECEFCEEQTTTISRHMKTCRMNPNRQSKSSKKKILSILRSNPSGS